MFESQRRIPIQDRAQATLEALIEATAQVLVEVGYTRLSTNRVAKRAGVSVGSLYQYFADKDALVEALSRRVAERQIQVVIDEIANSEGKPLDDAVRSMICGIIASKRVEPELAQALAADVPRHGRIDVERMCRRRLCEVVSVALMRRQTELDTGSPELAAFTLVHATFGVIRGALEDRPELIADDALIESLTALCLRYLVDPSSAAASGPATAAGR